ncbi:MAG: hypothetical protein Q8K82_12695 [Gemmatimonadaceae bacterium]|nr:hypothetical protein [Gemmatimonadaceae bacterium]
MIKGIMAQDPYATLRGTFPLRPSNWSRIPGLAGSLWERVSPWMEGFRMGWSKRHDVWSKRKIGKREILWWLYNGVSEP